DLDPDTIHIAPDAFQSRRRSVFNLTIFIDNGIDLSNNVLGIFNGSSLCAQLRIIIVKLFKEKQQGIYGFRYGGNFPKTGRFQKAVFDTKKFNFVRNGLETMIWNSIVVLVRRNIF